MKEKKLENVDWEKVEKLLLKIQEGTIVAEELQFLYSAFDK